MRVKDLWSTEKAMEELGVSRATMHRWMSEGVLPFFKLGRKSLFKPEDVLAMLKPGNNSGIEFPDEAELDEALNAFIESDNDSETFTQQEIKQMAAEMLTAFRANKMITGN